jgi:hypothetical protein
MAVNAATAISILNVVFGLLGGNQKTANGKETAADFPAILKKCTACAKKNDSPAAIEPVGKKPGKTGSASMRYLDALREGFLKRGVSPDNVYISRNDSDMLAGFLRECGFPETKIKETISRITGSRPDGMIKLSDFIAEAEKPTDSGKKEKPPVVLESSAIPKIESIMIGSGLSIKESGHLLSSSRAKDGGLDLDRLISGLKKMDKTEKGGLNNTDDKISGKITGLPAGKDELIAGLERLRSSLGCESAGPDGPGPNVKQEGSRHKEGNVADIRLQDKTSGLPQDVRVSMEKIIQKSTTGPVKTDLVDAGMRFTGSPADQMKGGSKTDEPLKIQEGGMKAFRVSGKSGARHAENTGIDEPARNGKQKSVSEREHTDGDDKGAVNETLTERLTAKSGGVFRGNIHTDLAGDFAAKTISRNGGYNAQSEYSMDRMGMHIAKSIARGDGVLKLNLSPPELGTVNLYIKMKDNALHLGIVTENPAAKEAIVAGYYDLKNSLADQGIRLETVNVQTDRNPERSFMNLNEGSGREHHRQNQNDMNRFELDDIKDELLQAHRNSRGRDYLLDLEA